MPDFARVCVSWEHSPLPITLHVDSRAHSLLGGSQTWPLTSELIQTPPSSPPFVMLILLRCRSLCPLPSRLARPVISLP